MTEVWQQLTPPDPPSTSIVLGRAAPAPAHGWQPPPGWPPAAKVSYVRELITTFLLLLALPYITVKLLTNPGRLLTGLGRHHTT